MGESGDVGFWQHVYIANNCVYVLEYNLSASDWARKIDFTACYTTQAGLQLSGNSRSHDDSQTTRVNAMFTM